MRRRTIQQIVRDGALRVSRLSAGIPGYTMRERRFVPGLATGSFISPANISFHQFEQNEQADEMRMAAPRPNS